MGDSRARFGQCECGTVRYRVEGAAAELYHCHCSRCRRLYGTLFVTYAYVRREQFTIERGAERLSTYDSPLAHWYFCSSCGCHLYAEHDQKSGALWYMPATLDGGSAPGHPEGGEKHIFVGSKASWEIISDDLPQFDGYAPAAASPTSAASGAEDE